MKLMLPFFMHSHLQYYCTLIHTYNIYAVISIEVNLNISEKL
jgi:hypothetical protein